MNHKIAAFIIFAGLSLGAGSSGAQTSATENILFKQTATDFQDGFWATQIPPQDKGVIWYSFPAPSFLAGQKPPIISRPPDNLNIVSQSFLPMGHYTDGAGEAGFTINTDTPVAEKAAELLLIGPAYWFSQGVTPWKNPRNQGQPFNTLEFTLDMAVPHMKLNSPANQVPTASASYGTGYFLFEDRSKVITVNGVPRYQSFWYGGALYDLRSDYLTKEYTILDNWSGGTGWPIINSPLQPSSLYSTPAAGSVTMQNAAHENFKRYGFSVSMEEFVAAIRTVNKGVAADKAYSENPNDYVFLHFNLNSEVFRSRYHNLAAGVQKDTAMTTVRFKNLQVRQVLRAKETKGYLEGIRGGVATGWACTVGTRAPIDVRVMAQAANGQETLLAVGVANMAAEPAVNAACQTPGGTAHRYSIPLPPAALAQHQGKTIITYAHPGNTNARLALTNFHVSSFFLAGDKTSGDVAAPVDTTVIGWSEPLVPQGNGQYVLTGWTCVKNALKSLNVHVYAIAANGQGEYVTGAGATLVNEPAVGQACGTNGRNYRYRIPVNANSRFKGRQIAVYGLNPFNNAPGANARLNDMVRQVFP